MKINLNFQIKDLDGNDLQGEGANASKIIANGLANLSSYQQSSIKLMNWVDLLWKKKVLEIDKTDHEILIELVDKSLISVSLIVRSQVVNYLKSMKS
jgi:hypothetical protein